MLDMNTTLRLDSTPLLRVPIGPCTHQPLTQFLLARNNCNRLRDINKWWVGIRSVFPLFLSSSGYNVYHTKAVTPS